MDEIITPNDEQYDNDRAMAADAEPLSSDEQAIKLLEKELKDEQFLIDNCRFTADQATKQMKNAIERKERLERLLASRKNNVI